MRGPADDLAKSLSKGDFQKAARALEKLQKKLADSQIAPTEKKKLGQQLEQLKNKIDELNKQAKEAQADLRKRADQAKQAGDPTAAGKLEEELQTQQQGPQLQALKDLASKLGPVFFELQQGKDGEAAQSFQDALKQMQEMARQQGELRTLDGAMEQLADARRQMNCDKCGGKGCEECQGKGDGMAAGGEGDGKDGQPGQGLGQGKGDGARPEQKTNGKFYNSRVTQTVARERRWPIPGETGGPNLKNKAEAEIQKNRRQRPTTAAPIPFSGQRLPKRQSEHAREYFNRLRREGQSAKLSHTIRAAIPSGLPDGGAD